MVMLAGLVVIWEENLKCYITGIDWFIWTLKDFHLNFNIRRTSGNWNSDVYKVFTCLNMLDICENMVEIDFASAK